jgi:hypothetical protein
MRHPTARLDVTTFDASRFAAWQERAKEAGVSLHPMSELMARDPDWRRHWYDLEMAINADHPMPDHGEPLPFATFAGYLDSPLVNKEAAFFALDGDGNYVGQSTFRKAHCTGNSSMRWSLPRCFDEVSAGIAPDCPGNGKLECMWDTFLFFAGLEVIAHSHCLSCSRPKGKHMLSSQRLS